MCINFLKHRPCREVETKRSKCRKRKPIENVLISLLPHNLTGAHYWKLLLVFSAYNEVIHRAILSLYPLVGSFAQSYFYCLENCLPKLPKVNFIYVLRLYLELSQTKNGLYVGWPPWLSLICDVITNRKKLNFLYVDMRDRWIQTVRF